MPFPLRLNEVEIKIKLVSSSSIQDDDFREPLTVSKFDSEVTLSGQVNFGFPKGAAGRFEQIARSLTGDETKSHGHVLFRKVDLDKQGVTLTVGSLITEIAGMTMDLEINEVRPESPLRGEFLLIYAQFERRHEKRGSQ